MATENHHSIYQGVSRNSSCPCGSGKRFKHCHGSPSQKNSVPNTMNESASVTKLSESNHLFSTVEGKFYNLNNEEQYLFVADHSSSRIQLDKKACLILQEMEFFASFEDHFANCTKKFGVAKDQFKTSIDQLYLQGLLATAQSVLEPLKKRANIPVAEVAGICIRTCESPKYLKRILDSQIRRKSKFSCNEKVFVFDDSSKNESINKNIEVIENVSDTIDVVYLGLEWQINFVGALVKIFPEDENIINSLLLPQKNVTFSGGRIMNLALLFFAGKRYLNFDDDFILDDVRIHHNTANKLQLGVSFDRVFDGYDNENHVKKSGTALDFDPLSLHKKTLGLSLSEFIHDHAKNQLTEASFSGLNCYNQEKYQNNSFIVTSGNGWFGTTGKRDGRFIFYNSYKQTKPPWDIATNFDQLLKGGYCWDSIYQTEITNQAYSTPAGINNAQLLAPTVAVCKGEDTLLCTMANILYPNSVHLGYPWALAHFRKTKNWEKDTFYTQKPLLLPDVIKEIAATVLMPESASSDEKLEFISDALYDASQLTEKIFFIKIQSTYMTNSMLQITKLHEQIETLEDKHDKVKSVIERLIKNDLGHLYSNKLPPIEDAVGNSETDQLRWLKKELETYALGLKIWPKLWKYCAALNKNKEGYIAF